MEAKTKDRALADRVKDLTWYHTIELPEGVVTPGDYDTVVAARRFPFPTSFDGKRCLDVGTSDGFWAFEMERRGAAEVVAVDIDDPSNYDWPEPRPGDTTRPANREVGPNPSFMLAHEALASNVDRRNINIYEISPEALGRFDYVFMGSLMLHLRDPVGALAAVRSVVEGEFLQTDVISLWSTVAHPGTAAAALDAVGKPRWWTPNMTAYRRMVEGAGFEILESGGPYFIPFGHGFAPPLGLGDLTPARLRSRSATETAFGLVMRRLGAPAAWARCRPHPSLAGA